MICNKFYRISLISALLLCLALNGSAFAMQYGKVNNSTEIDYSKIDINKVLQDADTSFDLAFREPDFYKRQDYLQNAASGYYIVSNAQLDNIYAIVRLARTYDMQKRDRVAKAAFSQALGVNPYDIDTNYYYGDFYNKRNNYKMALSYYKKAFEYGMSENASNTKKMAELYEKLGDLQKANIYYKRTYLQNPANDEVADKIREIETIKYQNSDYYRRTVK